MYRLPPLRLLGVFETVHRAGGVKQAAKELNVSQPAVSQALRQLEEHIGAQLLNRATRPASLTEAGDILLKAVTDNLERLTAALEDIRTLTSEDSSSVTLACTIGFATYWLMPRLEAFYLDHPDIAVNVQTTQQEVPVLGAGTDIALRYGDGRWADGTVALLFPERIEPVCAPALAQRIAQSTTGLASAFLIHVDFTDRHWVNWPQYLSRTNQHAAESAKGLRFSNYVQATQAAMSGHGVMLGWRSITGDHVEKSHLVHAGLEPLIPRDGYHAVLSHRCRNPGPAKTVVEWLKREAAHSITTVQANSA
ncbi:DNA-binding transcriptional LysR family regulator [Roseibium hamelinense]|uniref:DNA-binding transcriptional LysR family regulator n=1 Tax=Roseibium hamelinense TaxID=150831 RepID=A0A562SPI4_9HYPH|nr:LysR substrate-binding domain-containing protein [Roseibium hamelinense]MTI44300.1 LysR family transcriptional regulator [Roseibium hamelinense]TWI82924.1 DNA-binding transcriptional LysR family regulator [Roseibium hamelinense]